MGLELLLLIAGIAAFAAGHRRIGRLEAEIAGLRERLDGPRATVAIADSEPPFPRSADGDAASVADFQTLDPIVEFVPSPYVAGEAPEPPRRTVESLIGGQLPIWVGGAALVVAAFFLVRYSIETGLLSPGIRVALAAILSVALIVASEVARRLPATRDDPRVGQVLAGAGTASAYGTLYVAAAQYQLVGPLVGFLFMIAITAGALFLALKHGSPTAIMALIGGFAAPVVAGFDAAGIGPLLVYLALFIAALFALAAHRGWRWLALAALVAGFGWANLLIILLDGRETAGVGAFVVALAIGATLALPRTGTTRGWLRAAPLVAGLVQLLVVAPTLDFGSIAWIFHLVLAAAAMILARRDPGLQPAALVAAFLTTALVAAGLLAPDLTTTPVAAGLAAVMFGTAGSGLSRRAPVWAGVALVGIAGPLLTAHVLAPQLASEILWTALELLAAVAAAFVAWRHRDRADARDVGLLGGTSVAALLAAVALATLAEPDWAPLAASPVLLGLGWWANRVADRDLARLPTILLAAIALLGGSIFARWAVMIGQALAGEPLVYPLLPGPGDIIGMTAAPAAVAALLFRWPNGYGAHRPRVAAALAIVATLCLYTLAKQPLAIATPAAFAAYGFAERAAITLTLAAVGLLLTMRTRFFLTGQALLTLALARFVWFDLGLHTPVAVAQHVGPLPIVNGAVLLPALLAIASWRISHGQRWRWATLALSLVATLAAVRQIAHGTLLTGPLGSGETWGYSAALLVLASAWLWRGLATYQRDLRVAALALLTLVTIKVFLLDVAALGGLLRILSFLGLGLALIGIGWAYNRLIARPQAGAAHPSP